MVGAASRGRHVMKRKVLIVEDSGLTRMQVAELVRDNFDADVVEAENGVEGWNKLENEPDLELIISDIEMPEMDGVEFIRKVRASDEYSFLPILVMTTLGQIKQRDDALNAGADAFLQKPVTLEALQELLRETW
jgi:two-component system chemotaxis response regulator CheY